MNACLFVFTGVTDTVADPLVPDPLKVFPDVEIDPLFVLTL